MWTKLDDGFTEHPKVVEAGALGLALHVSGMVYAGRNLTDGYIPESVARRLLDLRRLALTVHDGELFGIMESADELDLPATLVHLGLWHDQESVDACFPCAAVWPTGAVTGFLIHDYLDYNPTREKVLADRAAAKERRENAKRASAERRANVAVSSPERRPNVIDPDPLPTRPAPVPDLDLEPDPKDQEQDQNPRAEIRGAAIENGQKYHLDDHQTYLLDRIRIAAPHWKRSLTLPGVTKLAKAYNGRLTEGLEDLWQMVSDGDTNHVGNPFSYLEAICRRVVAS